MILIRQAALAACLALPAFGQFQFAFTESSRTWTLQNSVVRAVFSLTEDGHFRFQSLQSLPAGDTWSPPDSTTSVPFRLTTSLETFDEETRFTLVEHSSRAIQRQGRRQSIVLEDVQGNSRITLELELFAAQPVLRYRTLFTNRRSTPVNVLAADPLHWTLAAAPGAHRAFRVNQWVDGGRGGNFEPRPSTLNPGGAGIRVNSGAHGLQCSWLAIRDQNDQGVFFGWEFDGRLEASLRKSTDALSLSSTIDQLYRPVPAGQTFPLPAAFIGLFHGDWDEAGYRTQRFVEAAIAQPARDPNFPYVMWDSWGYQENFDEAILRRNAEIAAQLGIEVFVVDLGWARQIGDWHPDPRKFPNGLRPLSDYVHSLGMKFGLHLPFAEAAPTAPVVLANRDWLSPVDYGYFNARSLCLSHQPARDWIIGETVRLIDEVNLDWILQDGENMVKHCNKTTHTHHPLDSNYANAVDGLNFVVSSVQAQRPNTQWENCEDGGNMMTYSMTRRYVTSIAADDSGDLTTRQAVYGITYPFPPRYSDRYMPHDEMDTFTLRSYMFGGPWIFMNHLPAISEDGLEVAASEIALFKRLRGRIRDSKVIHLTGRPTNRNIDAIAAWHQPSDTAVAFVYRPDAPGNGYTMRLRDLKPERFYNVRFQNSPLTLRFTGEQIATSGIRVPLPIRWIAEIVYVEPDPL
ncbi:MAG: alpha-galactosidase [Acidobacteriia bacterium]|nr:alpha-galactosidase [Terriglobia bacterium]